MYLLSTEERGRLAIARRCPAAAAAGVSVGMDLAEARALLPGRTIVAQPLDEGRDLEALRRLATWAYRFAPLVALDPPDGLLLDVTGCAPLFHGEGPLVDALVAGIVRRGIAARAAVAGTLGCAWARARYGGRDREVVPAGTEEAALARLPVAALRLPPEAIDVLEEVGVERVGALAALARIEVAARFPPLVLARVDQALGRADERVVPLRPRTAPRVERTFPGPVRSLEGVTRTVRALVGELAAMLDAAALGALAVEVTLHRSDAPPVRLARALSRRSADPRHLWALLAPAIEDANLGFGVDRIELVAARTGRRRPQEAPAWTVAPGEVAGDPEPERAVAELLDALAGRLGPARLVRLEAAASHVPEGAFRSVPVVGTTPDRAPARGGTPPVADAADARGLDRPSLLFPLPEAARGEAASDGTGLSRLDWRGETHAIVDARGPERIAPRWWEHAGDGPFPAGERAYVVATTRAGRRLWVFLETASGRWFVHGEWA